MTDEKINAAIAEACGDYICECCKDICKDCDKNYCTDLNAMHEAEEILSEDELEIIYPKFLGAYREPNKVIRATAHQRAVAFLKTLGKWKDE